MASRIFIDQHLPESGAFTITKSEQIHYLKNVLRVRKKTNIQVFGLCQREYDAVVESVSGKSVEIQLLQRFIRDSESPVKVTLGQSISRGQRMDYTIQKATELGVNAIAPIYSDHCQTHMNEEQASKKRNHWTSIAKNAAEQSNRLVVPEIAEPEKLDKWLNKANQEVRLILHESCKSNFDFSRIDCPDSVALLIGPEGGFSALDLEMAKDYGFVPMQLGDRVLRTETAAPVILSLVQWFWGDFRG